MLWWRSTREPNAYDDDWEDQPAQSSFHKWVIGAIIPTVMIGFATRAIINRLVDLQGRPGITLHGPNAVAYGIALGAAALFIHCHYFWGKIYNQAWFAVLGKIISAAAFIAALGIIIIRVGIFGHA